MQIDSSPLTTCANTRRSCDTNVSLLLELIKSMHSNENKENTINCLTSDIFFCSTLNWTVHLKKQKNIKYSFIRKKRCCVRDHTVLYNVCTLGQSDIFIGMNLSQMKPRSADIRVHSLEFKIFPCTYFLS